MPHEVDEAFVKAFPVLKNDQEPLLKRLLAAASPRSFAAGEPLYFEGDGCRSPGA